GGRFHEAQRVDADFIPMEILQMRDLDREDGNGRRRKADQDMGPEPRRALPPFPLDPDQRAKQCGQQQPGANDGKWQKGRVAELVEKLLHGAATADLTYGSG